MLDEIVDAAWLAVDAVCNLVYTILPTRTEREVRAAERAERRARRKAREQTSGTGAQAGSVSVRLQPTRQRAEAAGDDRAAAMLAEEERELRERLG